MVMIMCYNCKAKLNVDDPYSAPEYECPQCKGKIIIPENPCGDCMCSAQLADAALICCMFSTSEKIMIVPFNMDAAKDGVCPHFKRPGDNLTEDLEAAQKEIDKMAEEVAKPVEKTAEEGNEFDDAFDKLGDDDGINDG